MLPVVNVEGRLAADPELRFSASGTPVLSMRIVASSRKKDGDQWVDDKTLWLSVTAFKKLAENVAESLGKGDLVIVQGKLQTEEWENREGEKRSEIRLIADTIGPSLAFRSAQLLDGASSGGSRPASGGGDSAPAAPAQEEEPPF
jgi:single-strand DNA-binding protein